ncbi:HAD-like domain-containing protein [Neohortaea acidophila]|uniref:phosphoserine phosphatase n=1 Tax=Neohortaea acidophila TaxID=245834 RepID=A0A6A6Q139_9PEZI|nr:HAD-like domain-containing protein [Neohortaea acidophila]KAF2486002.1 HAD-like domain-containing protein [Neohortaea acidophila]
MAEKMASAAQPQSPNLVIHILSQHVRTEADWNSLIESNFAPNTQWTAIQNRLLDSSSSDSTKAAGKVLEIRATLTLSNPNERITVDHCKALRNSEAIQHLQQAEKVEVVHQPFDLYLDHRTPGLAVFDMDSTLIQQEVIDELARAVGRYDEVAAITEAAMRGELDFEASLRARVGKLEGVDANIWDKLKRDVITVTPGARLLVKALKGLGWKTAVLSGGFTPLALWLRDQLGLDYAHANHLALNEAATLLSGKLVPGSKIVDGVAKRELLIQLAEENGIPLKNAIAVGDGSNDLLMMSAAGWGIAFNAKPKVQEAAPARLNTSSLLNIMYLLGYTNAEIAKAADVEISILHT